MKLWLPLILITCNVFAQNENTLIHGKYPRPVTFTADEDRMEHGADVAVIGYGLWKNVFAGDPSVSGASCRSRG